MDPQTPSIRPLVTVVCPVFNEEKSVELFYARLCAAMKEAEKTVRYELLFVNNRSVDRTLDLIRELADKDPRVNFITLSRNFGYQASITAGMEHAKGDCSVNIDVDCEDPPEMIPRFIEKWLGGADIAFGIRYQREEFVLMHLARKLFYRVMRSVADHDIVLDMAEFFLIDRRAREFALSTRSTFPFVRGQVGYIGFRREGIRYKRERRIAGETHYNLVGAVRFGLAGILSSSTSVLRLLGYVGAVLLPVDLTAAFLIIADHHALVGADVPRYLLAAVLVHAGWLVFAAGVLGIYLARLYKDNVGLPLYIVDERLSRYREAANG